MHNTELISGCLFNARSIVNKVSELQQYEHYDIYILFVTETWLHKNISSRILDPNKHYNVLRKD